MSIEAAIGDSSQPSEGLTRLYGKIIDVHVDSQNPMRSYITVAADEKNNRGLHSGTFNVILNEEIPPAQRIQTAAVAEEKGSGITGGLINEKMKRRIGRPVLLNNFMRTGEGTGSCRWIDFYSTEIHRRSALVHTYAVADSKRPGSTRYPRITHLTVIRHDAFDVENLDAMERMKSLADKHFTEATRSSDYTVPQNPADPDGIRLNHIRSSMPRSAFAFVIIDKDSKQVLQYSNFLHQRSKFKDSDIPSHLTPEDAKAFKGRYPSLPYNGESLQLALNQVKGYAKRKYADSGITPQILCVEGVRYSVTKKSVNPDIQSLRDEASIRRHEQKLSPVEMIHLANQTQYASSSLPGEQTTSPIRRCAYVKDVVFSFAPNKGDTFSRYINCKAEYPMLDTPWITQITLDGNPLNVPNSLKAPLAASVWQALQNTPPPSGQEADQQHPSVSASPMESGQDSSQEPANLSAAAAAASGNAPATASAPTPITSTQTDPTNNPKIDLEQRPEPPTTPPTNPDADLYHGPGNLMFG